MVVLGAAVFGVSTFGDTAAASCSPMVLLPALRCFAILLLLAVSQPLAGTHIHARAMPASAMACCTHPMLP